MVQSKATTIEEYLNELPEEKREVISTVREVILKHLPDGYQEAMNYGMINYEIPLETYPDTYNGKPLSYISLAAQKNHYALYLMCAYQDPALKARLQDAFDEAGKTMDMGKSCLRFKRLEDLPLDAIGQLVSSMSPEEFIGSYEAIRKSQRS